MAATAPAGRMAAAACKPISDSCLALWIPAVWCVFHQVPLHLTPCKHL